MMLLSTEFEEMYPGLHILLTRRDSDYNEVGRYETLEQAKKVDEEFESLMQRIIIEMWQSDFASFPYWENENVINYIVKELKKDE